jgi:hypothetical protein
MLRFTPFRSAAVVLTLCTSALVSCKRPTDVPRIQEPGRLTVQANVAATSIATMVITVSAADITPSLVFNMNINPGGVAQGAIDVPAGSNRKLEIDAYDASQIKTHHSETLVPLVKPGNGNNRISIVLLPIAGQQPVLVEFGIFVVTVSPASLSLMVNETQTVTVKVWDDKGNLFAHDPAKLQLATTDPSVFSLTGNAVKGLKAGDGKVVATYEGYAGTATVAVADSPPTP